MKFNMLEKIAIPLTVALIIVAFVGLSRGDNARNELTAERRAAWSGMVENATSPQERDLMVFLASRLPGCLVDHRIDPDRLALAPPMTLRPNKFKDQERPKVLANEQRCFEALRGEALASTTPGQDLLSGVVLPR